MPAAGTAWAPGPCFSTSMATATSTSFVGRYIKFSYDKHVTRYLGGYPRYPVPQDYPPETNSLYRNNGDGTFTDVTAESGIGDYAGTCMGVIALDFDNDGNTDIFVCNDARGNFLLHNDGKGKFHDVAVEVCAAYDCYGNEHGNMGAMRPTTRTTAGSRSMSPAIRGSFPPSTRTSGGCSLIRSFPAAPGPGSCPRSTGAWRLPISTTTVTATCTWPTATSKTLSSSSIPTLSSCAKSSLFRNLGGGKFANISGQAGDGCSARHLAAAGRDDLDNDGRIDVVVLDFGRPPRVLRNESREGEPLAPSAVGRREDQP